jgi:hypothetical protein
MIVVWISWTTAMQDKFSRDGHVCRDVSVLTLAEGKWGGEGDVRVLSVNYCQWLTTQPN